MHRLFPLIIFLLMPWHAWPQADTLGLAYCQEKAIAQSPLKQQQLLYESIRQLQAENYDARNLPQFQVSGQYTYQSDVFGLPFEVPGTATPDIPKNQYQVNLEVSQKLFDGGKVKYGKEQALLEQQLNQQQVAVSLFEIKSTVNQLYFAALLLQENQRVLRETVIENLQARLKVVDARVQNGVMLKSAANSLRIELLRTEQQLQEMEEDRQAVLAMLVQWTEDEALRSANLPLPDAPNTSTTDIQRPEHTLFEWQQQKLELGKELVHANSLPQFFAFGRAGIGNPNPFNFFEVENSPFYLVGLKLEWRPFNYGTYRREKETLGIQQSVLQRQRENFDKMLALQLTQEQARIDKAEALLERDGQIIELQEEVVKQMAAQLENGVITSTDYISELNALTRARINQQVHEIQHRQAQIAWLTEMGQ